MLQMTKNEKNHVTISALQWCDPNISHLGHNYINLVRVAPNMDILGIQSI